MLMQIHEKTAKKLLFLLAAIVVLDLINLGLKLALLFK